MDFTLGISQGFRNAPMLYGDEIRPETRVTGFHSGLKAAGKEFSFGIFDGITGVVTQPIRGAKQDGAVGALKGLGRGFSGLVLKSGAAMWGLPAYAMKGVHREIMKLGTKDVTGYIASARAAQGVHEALQAPAGTQEVVFGRWNTRSTSNGTSWKGKLGGRMSSRSSGGSGADKKKLLGMETGDIAELYGDQPDPDLQRTLRTSISHQNPPMYQSPTYGENSGDAKRRTSGDDDEFHRAIWATSPASSHIPTHSRTWSTSADVKRQPTVMFDNTNVHGDDEDEQMRRALQASLGYDTGAHVDVSSTAPLHPEFRREDEQFQLTVRMSLDECERNSRSASANFPKTPDDPRVPLAGDVKRSVPVDGDDLAHAVNESLRLEEERKIKREEEERIVMEYVTRVSREEEELRQRMQEEQGSASRDV